MLLDLDGAAMMPKVILIGAGRGSRLMPLTTSQPKSFTPILSKRILDWTLEAFRANNLDDFVFISGYLKNVIEAEYPNFTFAENMDWENNNILFSLLTARDHLKNGFYATYTDTLFQASAIASLKQSTHDITLIMDTEWRKRYKFRSQHPESDGEKMITEGDQVIRVSREIDPEKASGEFTGVIKMTKKGAQQFLEFFDRLHMTLGPDGNFDESKPFRKAYLIHQLDRMIKAGISIHHVSVPGEYHEIDTLEDYDLACRLWKG